MSERVINKMWSKFEAEGKSQAGVELGWREYLAETKAKEIVDIVSQDIELVCAEMELGFIKDELENGLEITPAAINEIIPLRLVAIVDDLGREFDKEGLGLPW